MKSENVPKIQPKVSQSEYHESVSNEKPDEIENLESFHHDKPKEIQTKPKDSEEKVESIGVEKPHKLERTSRFQSMKAKNIKIKPKQTGEFMEPVEIQNKHEDMEALDKVKVEVPAEQKLKSAKVDDKKASLDVSQAKHIETTNVMEDFKVDLESVKPDEIKERKISIEVETKQQLDSANSLKDQYENKKKLKKLKPKPSDAKTDAVEVQSTEHAEATSDFKTTDLNFESQKVKPKNTDSNEKYIKVNVQDKVEKADELEKSYPEFDEITPSSQIPERKESVNVGIYDGVEITEIFDSPEPETDKGMSSKIPDRKESITVTTAEEQILSTKPYKGKIDEQLSENIKPKPVEDRKEHVLVIGKY